MSVTPTPTSASTARASRPKRSESYGGGPIEFHALLRRWREDSSMRDVLAE